ncbi:MAG: hypothetical protein WKF73_21510 [Nocardioidaceae bacterium]
MLLTTDKDFHLAAGYVELDVSAVAAGWHADRPAGVTTRDDQVRELAELRQENERLKKLLKLTDRKAAPAAGTQSAWFDRAPGPVNAASTPGAKVVFDAALFGAHRDVYAVPSMSVTTSPLQHSGPSSAPSPPVDGWA